MPMAAAQVKSPIFRNLNGGLNVREAITDIGDNEGALVSNCVYYTAGALYRRGGWQKMFTNSPTTNKLMGVFQAGFTDNTTGLYQYYLVITDGTDMWATANPTATTVAWTKITNSKTLDNTQPWSFLMMEDYMICYNGVAGPFYWAGSLSTGLQSLPTPSYTVQVGDVILVAVSTGSGGQGITIAYTSGATAGSEVVSVSGKAISVQIADGISTATQIVAAINASSSAKALVTASTQNGSNAQSQAIAATAIPLIPNQGAPQSTMAIVWQNFLFWGGGSISGTAYPNRLFFSDLGTPLTYPSANFVDVPNQSDADAITGLAILYGDLLVFKRKSFFLLQGSPPDNLILSQMNSSVGCINPQSVVQVDNIVYFVSDQGLYEANLFNVKQSSYKVEPRYVAAIPAASAANPIYSINYKVRRQIFVSMNAQSLYTANPTSYNDRILCHDYFNADQNGDPIVSEFICGYNSFSIAAAKPSNPTAPFLMAEYYYGSGNPNKNTTVMGTFYDPYVYVFGEGAASSGGPPDQINWMKNPTYPPTNYLTKFFDFGDPNMTKFVRWVWTTGQIYNNIGCKCGLILNNSPTVSPFINFNTDLYTLQAPNGNLYVFGVDDDGALTTTLTTDATFKTTITLADSSGQGWAVTVDNDGALETNKSSLTANTPPILISSYGYQYQVTVDTNGVLETTAVFSPTTVPITLGQRAAIEPLVNGLGSLAYGKYIQIYFENFGIISQFSFDLLMKGRRL
ncbi:MAG: hypothetical protein KGL39_14460 [Patescibacteria group bacterium]|nr:hypothetical protein [Patescibacteria group bacterium]